VKVAVSIGDLVDKVSILSIKLKKISDRQKLENIRKEHETLKVSMESIGISERSDEFLRLEAVNRKLWDIEDRIRLKEVKQEFDDVFIQLAREIYFNNDERSEIKRQINIKFGSETFWKKRSMWITRREGHEQIGTYCPPDRNSSLALPRFSPNLPFHP